MLVLQRFAYRDKYVVGKLYLGNVFFCHTLEPQNFAVGASKGCIPSGVYKVHITWSSKFKKMLPLLDSVPGFDGIRIHAGNTPLDTAGCILVGDNLKVGQLANSTARLNELLRLFSKNSSYLGLIHIKDLEK